MSHQRAAGVSAPAALPLRGRRSVEVGAEGPNPDALCVLPERQKFDPCGFKHPADGVECARPGIDNTLFKADHGVQGDDRAIRQLLTRPAEKGARCANLAGRDHPER
jgi:hypothetical protein